MNSDPVEKLASSEATNSTRRVISSGSATRAIAKWLASAATAAAASGPAVIGVRMGPGWTELTRMLSRPSSTAGPAHRGHDRADPQVRAGQVDVDQLTPGRRLGLRD